MCKKMTVDSTQLSSGKVIYDDLFADVYRQKEGVALYTVLIEKRENLIKERDPNPRGDNMDPSTGGCCCCSDALFTGEPPTCIECITIGK